MKRRLRLAALIPWAIAADLGCLLLTVIEAIAPDPDACNSLEDES